MKFSSQSSATAATIFLSMAGIVTAQTPPSTTVDGYITAAKVAAGLDWAGTFLRMCIPPPPGTGGPPGPRRGVPARETWYAEPAKVADNFYFLGTKIHSSWALVGSQGIIVIEALFDYAAPDEVLGGLKKLGLDKDQVKYVILSHAHGDHDGGAKLLQDSFPACISFTAPRIGTPSRKRPRTWAASPSATSPAMMEW